MVFFIVKDIFFTWITNLVFQPLSSYFTSSIGKIGSWESKEIPEECITPQSTISSRFDPEIIYHLDKGKIKLEGICLKQDSVCLFMEM